MGEGVKTHLRVDENYGLTPVDDEGIKYVYNRKVGDVLSCEIKQCRSYPQLKRFMAFIQVTFDMQDYFDNKESYRYWLTMKAGYFDSIVAPNGNVMFKAHSLAFDNMDEDVFKKVFSNCIDVFLKEYGDGLTEDALLEIVGFV